MRAALLMAFMGVLAFKVQRQPGWGITKGTKKSAMANGDRKV